MLGLGLGIGTRRNDGGAWWHPKAAIHIDYARDVARIGGVSYASVAAARSAGAIVQSGGIDRIPFSPAASWALLGRGVTAATAPTSAAGRFLVTADDGTTNNMVTLLNRDATGDYLGAYMLSGNSPQMNEPPTGYITPARQRSYRMGLRLKTNAMIPCVDGVELTTDTSATMPAVTQIVVGNRHDGMRPWDAQVQEVLVINEEISGAELAAALG